MAKAVINIPYDRAVQLYEELKKVSETAQDNDTIEAYGVKTNFHLSPEDIQGYTKNVGDVYLVDDDQNSEYLSKCTSSEKFTAEYCKNSSEYRSLYKANPLFLRELYVRLIRADAQDGKLDHKIDPQNWQLSPETPRDELEAIYKKYFTGPIPKDVDLFRLLDGVVSKNNVPLFPCDVYYAGPSWDPEISLEVFLKHFESKIDLLKEFAESRNFIASTIFYRDIAEEKLKDGVRRPLDQSDIFPAGWLNVSEELKIFDLVRRFKKSGQGYFAQLICNKMAGKNINAFGKMACDPEDKGLNHRKKSDDFIVMVDERGKSPENREWAEVIPGRPYVFINVHPKLNRRSISDPLLMGWKSRGQHLKDLCAYFRGVPVSPGEIKFLGEEQSEVSIPEIKKLTRLLTGYSIYRYFYYQAGKIPAGSSCESFASRPDFKNSESFFVRLFHETLHSYASEEPAKDSNEYYAMVATESKKEIFSRVVDWPNEDQNQELLFLNAFLNYLSRAIEYEKDTISYKAVFKGEDLSINEFASAPAMLIAPKYREYLQSQTQKIIRSPELKVSTGGEDDNKITYSSPL